MKNLSPVQIIFPDTRILLLLLLLLLKNVSSARLGESDIHPISSKTPAPQYQPIDRKKKNGKRVEDYSRNRAAQANKEALALLLKPASPTPSKAELARSFQRDTEKGTFSHNNNYIIGYTRILGSIMLFTKPP